MVIPILLGLTVLLLLVVIALLVRGQRGKPEGLDLLQQQLLDLGRQLGELRERQAEVPKALADGQVKNLEVLQSQLTQMVGAFNQQVNALTKQLSDGQSDATKTVATRLEETTRTLNEHLATFTKQLADGQGEASKALALKLEESRRTLDQQLKAVADTLNQQLASTQGNIGKQLQGATEVIVNVQRKLAEVSETAKQMQELGKDIGRLQDILQAPKLRGGLGEMFLGDLLAEMLPQTNYALQHPFASGERVDAAIRLGDKLVPVDSKFPLESFIRMREAPGDEERKQARKEFIASVKKRVDEIALKYIRPSEGTYDFALMYIPAENVFYEVIVKDEAGEDKGLSAYALRQHVVPVSPNSFYAYLTAIAYGLQGLRIERQAQELRAMLGELQQQFGRFYDVFTGVGKNLRLATEKYEDARKRAEKVNDRMAVITGKAFELSESPEALPGGEGTKRDGT
ncbi:MAG: DNA recombination protein RmuC [Planctomycetes bacterium]|nr:DNA recombination protein RmuC [Planctomycetota bacterium]